MLPQSLPNHLSVQTVAAKLSTRELSITELLQACLQRIELREPKVQAWTYLDINPAKKQAAGWQRAFKQQGSQMLETYPLLGIPVAVKDIFATLEMPTCWGNRNLSKSIFGA